MDENHQDLLQQSARDKETLSSDYIDNWKDMTNGFDLPRYRRAVVIGSNRKNNIGSAIANNLHGKFKFVGEPEVNEFDVTNCNGARNYFQSNNIDTLILSNGYINLGWFENLDSHDLSKIVNINYFGSMLAAQIFVQETINDKYKKQIIFIGSMAYKNVLNGSAAYCSSKAALAMLTRCLGWELAPKGYDVFCIHPSNTENTPMAEKTIKGLQRYRGMSEDEAKAYWGANLPKQKWLQADDIADCVEFLVSGKAEYLSGTNIDLSGGQR